MAQKVLELEPLKKKKLDLILVESEFPITWSIEKPETDDWKTKDQTSQRKF